MADEPLTLKPDGTIACSVGQTSYKLRRPNVGELRRLWEAWEEASDDTIAHRQTHADALEAVEETLAGDDTEAKKDARKDHRRIKADIRASDHAIWAAWIRDVFDTLGKQKLPESDDDLEPWLLTLNTGVRFLQHWQATPLASGVPERAELL